jgi:nitroreductase
MIGEVSLLEAFRSRRSVRVFEKRRIEPEVMTQLLEAVQSSPTAGNLQAYQVYLVETPDRIKSLANAALGQACVSGAPAVLVFCTDAGRSAVKYGDRGTSLYCLQDTTIAATFAHLAAFALGLGSVMVGAFNEREVARIIGAPPSHRPILLLPLGYPDENPEATDRRPIDEFVIRR